MNVITFTELRHNLKHCMDKVANDYDPIYIHRAKGEDICRYPFSGIGKPEPLKYDLRGYYSRRINDEHRLVYSTNDSEVTLISLRYHYSNH